MAGRNILWDKHAMVYFQEAIAFIRQDSIKNAEKIKAEVFKKIGELSEHPEIHPPDKYKLNNDGNYRAFELHRFRIGYLIKADSIIIARIRNTKQEPLDY